MIGQSACIYIISYNNVNGQIKKTIKNFKNYDITATITLLYFARVLLLRTLLVSHSSKKIAILLLWYNEMGVVNEGT